MTRLALVVAMLLLAAPSQAVASYNAPFMLSPPHLQPATPALQLAQRVWHPTCGQMGLAVGPVPAYWQTIETSIGGWASPGDCTIHLSATNRWLGGPDLCETILHEAGHVAGFREAGGPDGGAHSADPNNIMYPTQWVMRGRSHLAGSNLTFTVWYGVDRRCLRAYHAG